MSVERIPDDEIVYRRIPPTLPYFEPPSRVTSANFKLNKRDQELGLSVYRASIVIPEQVLAKPEAISGSRVVLVSVGEIRRATSGDGIPLQLDVVQVDDENNPGHAEIRSLEPGKLSESAAKALQRLFRLV